MVSLAQAKKLIKLAKDAISSYFEGKTLEVSEVLQKEFKEETGVFVSVYVKEDLAGCIGFPEPIFPLWLGVRKAAVSAGFKDPRFPPLVKAQMKDLRIELTVLTKPEVIEVKDPKEYMKKIKIGKDGLMVKDEFGSGLLLPQVPGEWGWNVEEFLNQTCMKGGLDPNCWRNTKRNIYKFQGQIFTEEKGKLVEKKLY
ncbi:TIGR00296 family protein [Candidatus Woesearchaeota archaeon]|nr:TIGR00296 family protein [Candidatus Woesearchaeota archaeon]